MAVSKRQAVEDMGHQVAGQPVDRIMCTPEQVRRSQVLVASWADAKWPGEHRMATSAAGYISPLPYYHPSEEAVIATATVLDALGIGGL